MTPSRRRAAEALRNSTGALSTAATGRMSTDLPWFDDLSAEDRSWVGLIVQAGIRGFVDWYDHEVEASAHDPLDVVVFGAAPRELTGVISLQQTVELVRLSIRVVETTIDALLDPEDAREVHDAVLLYAREVAFATAAVYARAAESRGAWDARLEALVVDAVVRAEADESVLSRASALGWGAHGDVAVVLGATAPHRAELDVFESVRRSARAGGMDALCATQGDRLVVVLGGVTDPLAAATRLLDHFGDGPVVVGPITADLAHANASARAALSAHRAASGWPDAPRPVASRDLLPERALAGDGPDAPRPVASRDLLPERALAGDGHARRHLVDEVYLPLVAARGTLLETLSAWFEHGSSIEATARALFVHPNTVRYRLRQISDATGWSPTRPREAFALQLALILGRQSGRTEL